MSLFCSAALLSTLDESTELNELAVVAFLEEKASDDCLSKNICSQCKKHGLVFECQNNIIHNGCRSCIKAWLKDSLKWDMKFEPRCRICNSDLKDLLKDLREEVLKEVIDEQTSSPGAVILAAMSRHAKNKTSGSSEEL